MKYTKKLRCRYINTHIDTHKHTHKTHTNTNSNFRMSIIILDFFDLHYNHNNPEKCISLVCPKHTNKCIKNVRFIGNIGCYYSDNKLNVGTQNTENTI